MEINPITIIGIIISAIILILTITLNLDPETGYLIISGLCISITIIGLILLINFIYKLIDKSISFKTDIPPTPIINITPINIGILEMMIVLFIITIITKNHEYLYLSPQIISQWLFAFTIKNHQNSFFIAPIHYISMITCGVFYDNIYVCIIGAIIQIILCIFGIKRK
jgi:hypothetical protein